MAAPGLASPARAAPARHPGPRPTTQQLLVGLGAALVLVAAAVFAAVTWSALGLVGQMAVLVASTLITASIAVWLRGRDLVATAEAVSVIVSGLALLNARAIQVSAFAGADGRSYWSVGAAVVATTVWAFGRRYRLAAPRFVSLLAAQAALPLLAARATSNGGDGAAAAMALALLIVAAVDWAAGRAVWNRRDRFDSDPGAAPATNTNRGWAQLAMWLAAAAWGLAALIALIGTIGTERAHVAPFLASGVVAAVIAGRVSLNGSLGPSTMALAAAGSAGSAIVAGGALGRLVTHDDAVMLVVAATGAVALVAVAVASSRREKPAPSSETGTGTSTPSFDRSDRRPAVLAARTVAFIGALIGLGPTLALVGKAFSAPFVSASRLWSYPTSAVTTDIVRTQTSVPWIATSVGILLAVSVVLAAGGRRRWTLSEFGVVGTGATFAGFVCLAASTSVPLWLAIALPMTGAAIVGVALSTLPMARWRGTALVPVAGATAFVAGSLASGLVWAVRAPWGTVEACAILVAGAGVATIRAVRGGRPTLAACCGAVALAASGATGLATTAASGRAWSSGWLSAVITVGLISSLAPLLERRPGLARLAVGVDFTATGVYVASSVAMLLMGDDALLTVALGFVGVIAGVRALSAATRPSFVVIAATAGVALVWLRLAVGDVSVVEAYAAPLVVVLGAGGWWMMQAHDELGSWPTIGPATAVALVPSLFVAIGERDTIRPLALLVVAAGVLVWGTHRRLRAPFTLGFATVVAATADQIGPSIRATSPVDRDRRGRRRPACCGRRLRAPPPKRRKRRAALPIFAMMGPLSRHPPARITTRLSCMQRPDVTIDNCDEVYDFYQGYDANMGRARFAHTVIGLAVRPRVSYLEVTTPEVLRSRIDQGAVVILASKHVNMYDPLQLVALTGIEKVFAPLVGTTVIPSKRPLFDLRIRGWIDDLGAVPTYRRKDSAGSGGGFDDETSERLLHCSERLIAASAALMKRGKNMAIFPESERSEKLEGSHPSRVNPLKDGVARMYLRAIDTVDIVVVPIGLCYDDRAVIRPPPTAHHGRGSTPDREVRDCVGSDG